MWFGCTVTDYHAEKLSDWWDTTTYTDVFFTSHVQPLRGPTARGSASGVTTHHAVKLGPCHGINPFGTHRDQYTHSLFFLLLPLCT
jgi:hypothetical protein